MRTPKSQKTYTDADRELFAKYREERATCRPKACRGGEKCWVELGPPALGRDTVCKGCGGTPRMGVWQR